MPGCRLAAFCILAGQALAAQDSAVQVRETWLTLPTYNEGAPDPNPQFALFSGQPFPNYPYTIRTVANRTRRMERWRVVVLENEYLVCRVLPDLGGHLHGCTDKLTGREVFYANPVVRRGPESTRRAFIATGIESSFPIAHSRVGSSPVGFGYSTREGSGRVVVEDTDRVSGMQWRVEYILRPGSAVLEQRVTLHNASAARRAYHWWANAAVALDDPGLRFVYPVKWMLPHGEGQMTPWPQSAAGIDLSAAANHKGQLGLFGHGSREPWMAVFKPAFRSGIAHYADPKEVPGKKLWLWGASDKYVKENLTENFDSYVEMQAGVFETQPETAFLLPEEVKSFTHYWIPFHGLGGISRATRDAVLNLERTGEGVLIELDATHAIRGARVRVWDGAKQIAEEQVDLDPKTVYSTTVTAAAAPVTVDVLDSSGAVVLHHVEGKYDALAFDPRAKNPEPEAPPYDPTSPARILARAGYDELQDLLAPAWHAYNLGLEKFPRSVELMKAAGRTAVALRRYADAIGRLAPLAATGNDAEAAYYYGVALAHSGRVEEAQVPLTAALLDPRWAPAARLQLAGIAARGGAAGAAVSLIQSTTAGAHTPIRTGAIEVALLRRAGEADAARSRLRVLRDEDPADAMLRFEELLLGGAEDAPLWSHLGADPERVLNLVDNYLQLGAFDDALKLLDRRYPPAPPNETEPGAVLPQEHPLVAYYRGYCRLKLGQDASADFKLAGTLPLLYVFPNRASSYPVLRAALAQNDADAAAHALLGNLYFNSLETDRAITEWRKAIALKRDLPAIHRNLERALLEVKKDPVAALPVLEEGLRVDRGNREIADALRRVSEKVAAAAGSPNTAALAANGPALADHALIRSVTDPNGAAGLFTAANFPKDKQPDSVRRAYIEVQLQRLMAQARTGDCDNALAKLERLGEEDTALGFTFYGFGAFMKPPHFQYYMGVVEAVCGAGKAARKRWDKLSKKEEPAGSTDFVFPYLARWRLGEGGVFQKMAAAVRAAGDGAPMELVFAQGVLHLIAGQHAKGAALLEQSARATDPLIQYLSLVALREGGRGSAAARPR
jgi:tetratricopeptide (TPR) repeat protein